MKKIIIILCLCCILSGTAMAAETVPLFPCEISGTVTINGNAAPAGTVITAYINGTACGSTTLTEEGVFGGDSVLSDRLVVTGRESGQEIKFLVDDHPADQTLEFTFDNLTRVDLTVRYIPPTTKPTSSGGGGGNDGGGGGGGSSHQSQLQQPDQGVQSFTGTAELSVDANGATTEAVQISTAEKGAALAIPEGIIVRDKYGNAATEISIDQVPSGEVPDEPSVGTGEARFSFAGHAVECSPAGATFSEPIHLTFTLSEEEWNGLQPGETFAVRWYNPDKGEWEDIPTTINAETREVTGIVDHFSMFAVFVHTGDQMTTPVVSPTETAATATANHTKTGAFPTLWIIGIILAVVIVSGAFLYVKKNKK